MPVAGAVAVVRGGRVVQQCEDCASGRQHVFVVNDQPVVKPRRRLVAQLLFAGVLLVFVAAPASVGTRRVSLRLDPTGDDAPGRLHRTNAAPRARPLAYEAYMATDPRPVRWVHPLAGDRRLPRSPSRRFGALRVRPETRSECGRGHCGVDLGHLRGEVVHAAADGIIDRIVRSDTGISGRYMRIRHSSGYTTFYMHLGRIHPQLSVGDRVRAGAAVGTIGLSGISNSPPHLHFAIRKPQTDGTQRFVDPEPFLREAAVRAAQAPFPGRDPN